LEDGDSYSCISFRFESQYVLERRGVRVHLIIEQDGVSVFRFVQCMGPKVALPTLEQLPPLNVEELVSSGRGLRDQVEFLVGDHGTPICFLVNQTNES